MGNHILHKGILLDERDFDDTPHSCMQTLSATIHDYLLDEFEFEDESGLPNLDLIGVAAERFDTTHMFKQGFGTDARWLQEGRSFRSTLLEDIGHLDLPDPEALLGADDDAIKTFEQNVQREICDRVMAGAYGTASDLIAAIVDIQEVGLPHIRTQREFERNGDDDLYDFRRDNHGPGNRILAEISFDWGQ